MTLDGWRRRDPWELVLQRVAFAALVYAAFHAQPPFSEQPFPVGIATWMDFTFLADPSIRPWIDLALVVALAAYVAGRAMPVVTAVMAALYVAAGALAWAIVAKTGDIDDACDATDFDRSNENWKWL